ncbi:MAG: hypothetical protein NZ990_10215 [Myxococcota bacterium]|nr:hypothetical protein [Myxococcota bacterium]
MKRKLAWILIAQFALAAASVAALGEKRTGQGAVDQVNATARTLTIGQVEYAVPMRCKPRRESGTLVPLAELRGAVQPGQVLVAVNDIDFVQFEAVLKAGGWEMTKITVLDGAAR